MIQIKSPIGGPSSRPFTMQRDLTTTNYDAHCSAKETKQENKEKKQNPVFLVLPSLLMLHSLTPLSSCCVAFIANLGGASCGQLASGKGVSSRWRWGRVISGTCAGASDSRKGRGCAWGIGLAWELARCVKLCSLT